MRGGCATGSEDKRVAYGTRCTWWGPIQTVGKFEPKQEKGAPKVSLPCCPHCKGMLFEWPNRDVAIDGAKQYEAKGHEGYLAFFEWMEGKCFPGIESARRAYQDAAGKDIEL